MTEITIQSDDITRVKDDLRKAGVLLNQAHSLFCVLELTDLDEETTASGEMIDSAVWQSAKGAAREVLSQGMNIAVDAGRHLPTVEEHFQIQTPAG